MLQVKPLTQKDFDFAVKLANTMNWQMTNHDFVFMNWLEPKGCFLAVDGTQRLGIATCVNYGKVGWFGNFIVKAQYRKKGIGKTLMEHSINYLQANGAETIGLYAYPDLVPFYKAQGFRVDDSFSFLKSKNLGLACNEKLLKVDKKILPEIYKFDKRYFGGDRQRLIDSIILDEGNLSYYISENENITGYIAVTVNEKQAWVGPLVCEASRHDVATLLIKVVLSKLTDKSVYLVLPKKEKALFNLLINVGFVEEFFVYRMFLGEAVVKNCIYFAESLERG